MADKNMTVWDFFWIVGDKSQFNTYFNQMLDTNK